ncbi:STAS/SEC14 domain-containing protein [Pontibacter arcticus]|uniref:STAS/SEC14 domain-containing protein n=1 Tax=Pontibacter arcticus TaxID=2080288 RepID=A0A364RCD2_9BACT|nr:STAS/SEC14 domain-containing protein [Pontibacter arcticus]RAU81816.1 STAS/SEC14 domain-containing protein [Pontibacter arcticus]
MKKEICNAFGNVFLTVEYEDKYNLVHNNWLGYQTLENVMLGANACLELLAYYNCPYLLNDNRLVIGDWNHANDWIANEWTPLAVENGLRYFAHVVNPESYAALSAQMMEEQVSGLLRMRIFEDFEEARNWIITAQPADVPIEI